MSLYCASSTIVRSSCQCTRRVAKLATLRNSLYQPDYYRHSNRYILSLYIADAWPSVPHTRCVCMCVISTASLIRCIGECVSPRTNDHHHDGASRYRLHRYCRSSAVPRLLRPVESNVCASSLCEVLHHHPQRHRI